MKNILLVTRNFPPLTGGMERLNLHLYFELNKTFYVSIAGPAGCREYLDADTQYHEFPHRPVAAFLFYSFWATLRLALRKRPDIIIAGSGITALSARLVGYLFNAKVITFLHGLDIIERHPIYRAFFFPAIRASDRILVNSNSTARLAVSQRVAAHKIKVIHPGVRIPLENIFNDKGGDFRTTFGIPEDTAILLSVGRLTERKGLVEFISHSLADIVKAHPKTILVIIGDEPSNAFRHKTGLKNKILKMVKKDKLENHVMLLGHVTEHTLEAAFKVSQLHIFPVIDLPNDIEGFGMVAIEAAAYGLPTFAFAVGGVPDAIADNVSGYLFQSDDYQSLTENIIQFIIGSKEHEGITQESCKHHAAKFSWILFGENVSKECHELLQ
ncbi:glycosyltransferase family 4 protein [Methylomonas albis]|uniref:Glycosyltransferase family 4 protein n=1 Tax=Methylomonas albis TaxID=1854563 RepID=A0ABR9CZT4_9GAMM|nr:glycosyltransferase family 4 protein [Methylomonas albis]MBD9356061.1 glycosyltransferase family 4 protein [Methylomonas albis]